MRRSGLCRFLLVLLQWPHKVGAQDDAYTPIDVAALYSPHQISERRGTAAGPLVAVGASPVADYFPNYQSGSTCSGTNSHTYAYWQITTKGGGTEAASSMVALRLYNRNDDRGWSRDRMNNATLKIWASQADFDNSSPSFEMASIGDIARADQGGTLISLGDDPVPVWRLQIKADSLPE
eukprot:g5569.t1